MAAPPSQDRIVIDPGVRFGTLSVRGTRISVGDVLSYLAAGMSADAILADFPRRLPATGARGHPGVPRVRGRAGPPAGECALSGLAPT